MHSSHDRHVAIAKEHLARAAEHLIKSYGSIPAMHSSMGELLQAYGEARNLLAEKIIASGFDAQANEYIELHRLRPYIAHWIENDPIRRRFVEVRRALDAGNIDKAKRLINNALNRDDLISERQQAISTSRPRKLDDMSVTIQKYLLTQPDLTLLPLIERLLKDHVLDEVDAHRQMAVTREGVEITLRALEGRLARAKKRQYRDR